MMMGAKPLKGNYIKCLVGLSDVLQASTQSVLVEHINQLTGNSDNLENQFSVLD